MFFTLICLIFVIANVNCLTKLNCLVELENPECGSETITCFDYYMRGYARSGYYKLRLVGSGCSPSYPVLWCQMDKVTAETQAIVHNSFSYNNYEDIQNGNDIALFELKHVSYRLLYNMDLQLVKVLMDVSETCAQDVLISCKSTAQNYGGVMIRSVYSTEMLGTETLGRNFTCDEDTEDIIRVLPLGHENAGIYGIGFNNSMGGKFIFSTGPLTCSGKKYGNNGCNIRFLTSSSYLSHKLDNTQHLLNVSMYFRTHKSTTSLLYSLDSVNNVTLSIALSEGRILEVNNQLINVQAVLQSSKTDNEWHFLSVHQDDDGCLKVQVDFEIITLEKFVTTKSWTQVDVNVVQPCFESFPNFQGCLYNFTINDKQICLEKTKSVGTDSESCFGPIKHSEEDVTTTEPLGGEDYLSIVQELLPFLQPQSDENQEVGRNITTDESLNRSKIRQVLRGILFLIQQQMNASQESLSVKEKESTEESLSVADYLRILRELLPIFYEEHELETSRHRREVTTSKTTQTDNKIFSLFKYAMDVSTEDLHESLTSPKKLLTRLNGSNHSCGLPSKYISARPYIRDMKPKSLEHFGIYPPEPFFFSHECRNNTRSNVEILLTVTIIILCIFVAVTAIIVIFTCYRKMQKHKRNATYPALNPNGVLAAYYGVNIDEVKN